MSEDRYFHHDHPLVFRTDLGDDVKEEDICSKCKREIGQFPDFFKCSECHFFIHLVCINEHFDPGSFQPYKTFTFHFSHWDPLVLIEELKNDGTEELVSCSGCEEQIPGPGFKCFYYNCRYFLHKSCTELAHEIQHPLHPDHHMTLVTRWEALHSCSCDACGKHCSGSFFYECRDCQGLGLDIKCASRSRPSKDDYDHQHSFVLLPKQIQFACDNCGKEREDCGLKICGICRLLIHTTCDRFPRTIKIIFHQHFLTLTYYLHQVEERADIFCEICRRPVKKNYAGYYCQKCNYGTVHLECAAQYKDNREIWSATEESIKYITELIDDANLAEKERGRPRKLQHFSHEHELILNDEDEEVKDDKLCDGCMHLISVPFYSCTQCNFFLHNKCAKLPKQATHRRLSYMGVFTLLPQPRSSDGVFFCPLCSRYRRGFVYSGADDYQDVMVDVICFAIEDVLRTDGHRHPLLLATGGIFPGCKACGDPEDKDYRYFVCSNQNCNFTLGYKCATLPSKARHRYDDHLLTLTFIAEDETGEYYCLICEEERDPNHWFYYCAKCEFAAHPQCVLGKNHFIKPGKTYKDDDHEHPVTFVRKTEYSPPCGGCGSPFINEVALECVQCELSFHVDFKWYANRISESPCLRKFDKYIKKKTEVTISDQIEDSIE